MVLLCLGFIALDFSRSSFDWSDWSDFGAPGSARGISLNFAQDLRRNSARNPRGFAFEIPLAKFRAKTERKILKRAVRELASSPAARFKISCRELVVKFKISRSRAHCHVSLRDSKFHVERTVKLIRRSRSRSPHDLKFALAPRHTPLRVKLRGIAS